MSDSSLPDNPTDQNEKDFPMQQQKPLDVKNESAALSGKQEFNLNWICNNEDLVITGAKGSGKSFLANTLLKSLNNIPCWVWDYNHHFYDSRSMLFHDLDDMLEIYDGAKRGKYILQPFDKSKESFERFCNAAFARGNLVIFLDELHVYTSKQSILRPFNNLILSGRPRGISVVSISSRSASLPNNVLSNSQHVFSFRLNLQSDVEFLEAWMGEGVWLLLPKDKRKKLKDQPELPDHTFFYRNQSEKEGVVGKV